MGVGAVVIGLVLLAVVVLYNRLVRLRAAADHAWAQVDAQLQRRHDLVPALVATVAGYAGHESRTLAEVTEARAAALLLTDRVSRGAAEDRFGAAIGRLLAVAESYPRLRADARFAALQGELAATEDRIAFARGFANDRVRRYREAISSFPGVLVARPFGFRDRAMFAAVPDGRGAVVIEEEDVR